MSPLAATADDVNQNNLDSIVQAARSLHAEAEERLAKLRASSSASSDADAEELLARGVALASFGPEDVRRLRVEGLSDDAVREALAPWGPVRFDTTETKDGFHCTLELDGLPDMLPDLSWTGVVAPCQAETERSAAVKALVELSGRLEDEFAFSLADDSISALCVQKGDGVEIVVRNREGWACCRRGPACEAAWLPRELIAELAVVVSDHALDGEDEALSASRGDIVEVMLRHHSGWFFCREWFGVERHSDARRSGWIFNSYLQGYGSEDRVMRNLAMEALESLAGEATNLEAMVEAVRIQAQPTQPLEQYFDKFLRLASGLATELDAISKSVEHAAKDCRPETAAEAEAEAVAVASRAVDGDGPEQLSCGEGARFLVLQADADSGWCWCRPEAGGAEGWVPSSVLCVGAESARSTLGSFSSRPKMLSASASRPICAICMERLALMDDGYALPCAHAFHGECLLPWLREKAECPLCRAPAGCAAWPGARGDLERAPQREEFQPHEVEEHHQHAEISERSHRYHQRLRSQLMQTQRFAHGRLRLGMRSAVHRTPSIVRGLFGG